MHQAPHSGDLRSCLLRPIRRLSSVQYVPFPSALGSITRAAQAAISQKKKLGAASLQLLLTTRKGCVIYMCVFSPLQQMFSGCALFHRLYFLVNFRMLLLA